MARAGRKIKVQRDLERMADHAPGVLMDYLAEHQIHLARGIRNMRKYGLTEVEVVAMFRSQGGVCAICRMKPDVLVIDHDHVTGEVRGLLCSPCNTGLGMFKDSIPALGRAISYLRS